MLVDISDLQDKLLEKHEDSDVPLSEVPIILQKTYETVAVLLYCAQRIEHEIREFLMTPDFVEIDVRRMLSDEVAGKKVLESIDELCNDPLVEKLIDVSVSIGLSDQELMLKVLPIYSCTTPSIDDTYNN